MPVGDVATATKLVMLPPETHSSVAPNRNQLTVMSNLFGQNPL